MNKNSILFSMIKKDLKYTQWNNKISILMSECKEQNEAFKG